ncbi:unnamed protein product [Paramecium sonneborni]|uniref:Uncharacterized protein n=1 Tax=Paramecium sonneborni TaxID=65129 RepID=A0A8S1RGB9_9CILI|nr:unnamed protein product [Paramecium sonneborni]
MIQNYRRMKDYCAQNAWTILILMLQTIGFNKVIQIIEDRKKKRKDLPEGLIVATIKSVEEFQSELVQLKSSIIQYLNELFRFTTDWIQNLSNIGQSQIENYSFFQELDYLIQNPVEDIQGYKCEELDKVNYSWSQKLLPKFQMFQCFPRIYQRQGYLEKCIIPKVIDKVCVFKLEDGFFQKNLDKQIELTQNSSDDYYQVPIIFNKEKGIIIILRKSHIHIIQKCKDGTLKIVEKLGKNGNITGALRENGQHLVIWDSDKAFDRL